MRVSKGWGTVEEESWPDDGKTWPIIEPQGLDPQAKARRIGAYQRVNTVEECRICIYPFGGVGAAFEIDDSWYKAPKGVIPQPKNQPITGSHTITLVGYDNHKQRFIFLNSWGARWGRRGMGFLPNSYFPDRFLEGWTIIVPRSIPWTRKNSSVIDLRRWANKDPFGNTFYGAEIVDFPNNEIIAWGFAIERETSLNLEELFVRPNWRRRRYGTLLAAEFTQLGTRLGKRLRAWVPHPDGVKGNEEALNKILHQLGLSRRPSPVRWAAAIGE